MAEGSAGTDLNPFVLLKETVQTHRRLKFIFYFTFGSEQKEEADSYQPEKSGIKILPEKSGIILLPVRTGV